jgi:hypothetical protein
VHQQASKLMSTAALLYLAAAVTAAVFSTYCCVHNPACTFLHPMLPSSAAAAKAAASPCTKKQQKAEFDHIAAWRKNVQAPL